MSNAISNSHEAYEKALDILYELINFEAGRQDRYMASKLDTERPGKLMELLGSPQKQYRTIHIAGTKGKGSVAATCAAVLREAGLRVALYTSPHVREFRERIRILTPSDTDGMISEADFADHADRVLEAMKKVYNVTWFEAITAIGFLHFARQGVDVAVIEVGLGGRLDATNVITPLVSVITSLSLDHTEFLGSTLAEIAAEKGGIIKPGVPVVCANQKSEALSRLLEIADQRKAPVTVIGQEWQYSGSNHKLTIERSGDPEFVPASTVFQLALAGVHQLENSAVAIAALSAVRIHFPGLTLDAVSKGLASVSWIGRLQMLHHGPGSPSVLVDCAHNVDSAIKLRQALESDYDFERLWLVLGTSQGKDVSGVLTELLPLAAGAVATMSVHPRATPTNELAQAASKLGFSLIEIPTVSEAFQEAWSLASPGDLICVTGSIFVVGDLLNEWESLKSGNPVMAASKAN